MASSAILSQSFTVMTLLGDASGTILLVDADRGDLHISERLDGALLAIQRSEAIPENVPVIKKVLDAAHTVGEVTQEQGRFGARFFFQPLGVSHHPVTGNREEVGGGGFVKAHTASLSGRLTGDC